MLVAWRERIASLFSIPWYCVCDLRFLEWESSSEGNRDVTLFDTPFLLDTHYKYTCDMCMKDSLSETYLVIGHIRTGCSAVVPQSTKMFLFRRTYWSNNNGNGHNKSGRGWVQNRRVSHPILSIFGEKPCPNVHMVDGWQGFYASNSWPTCCNRSKVCVNIRRCPDRDGRMPSRRFSTEA